MDDKSFDNIINSKLSDFSSEKESGAWELFEERSEGIVFDEVVKTSLSPFSIERPDSAWEMFEKNSEYLTFDESVRSELLDFDSGEVPTDFDGAFEKPMTGFDALIGAKLAQVNMNDGSDWENFAKLLDDTDQFDADVKKKVEDFEVSESENHWPQLSAHLEKVERRRRRIIITKFIEAAVFILFIITIMQLYPIENIARKSVYRTHGVADELRNNRSKKAKTLNKSATEEVQISIQPADLGGLASEEALSSEENIELQRPAAEIQFLSNNPVFEIAQRAPTTKELLFVEPVSPLKLSVNAENSDGGGISNSIAAAVSLEKNNQLTLGINLDGLNVEKTVNSSVMPGVALASLDIPELHTKKRNFSGPISDLASKINKGQYWFNIYGSAQINLINTPYDISYDDSRAFKSGTNAIEAYSHMTEGYTLGASLSKESADFEIELGAEYTSLNYYPKQITELVSSAKEGYKEVLLKEIIFDIIEIPLSIKYNIFKKKGWRVYGTNGLSLGIVAFADHDIEIDDRAPLSPLASSLFPPNPSLSRRQLEAKRQSLLEEASFINNKDFNEGLIRSGDIQANSYATISMGAGVSKEISDKMSFYIQPTYYHNLSQSGIGPNNDVHHRLALQVGTKVRL